VLIAHTKLKNELPGEIAELICLDAEYKCFTNGILLINHSPTKKTVAPSHEEANIPMKSIKMSDVTNPRPGSNNIYNIISEELYHDNKN
jgi:hypothetical protein